MLQDTRMNQAIANLTSGDLDQIKTGMELLKSIRFPARGVSQALILAIAIECDTGTHEEYEQFRKLIKDGVELLLQFDEMALDIALETLEGIHPDELSLDFVDELHQSIFFEVCPLTGSQLRKLKSIAGNWMNRSEDESEPNDSVQCLMWQISEAERQIDEDL